MKKKKPDPLSPAAFARQIGLTRQAVSKAIQTGVIPTITVNGKPMINPGNPAVIEYARNALYSRSSGAKSAKISEAVADRKKKNAETLNPVIVTEKDIPAYLKKMADSGNLSFEQFLGLSKSEADKIKIYEQLKQIRVHTDRDRKELISRKLVRVVMGKLHEIDVNEFLQLKTKIVPDIAGIMGCTDAAKMLECEKKIDEEMYKILRHVKHEIDKFLKNIGGEYE